MKNWQIYRQDEEWYGRLICRLHFFNNFADLYKKKMYINAKKIFRESLATLYITFSINPYVVTLGFELLSDWSTFFFTFLSIA